MQAPLNDQTTVNDDPDYTPAMALPGSALTCLNNLKHGGSARSMFLPGENPQEFFKLLAESFETHTPGHTDDAAIVTDSVVARWILWRRQRISFRREFEICAESTTGDQPSNHGLRDLANIDRYRTTAERTFARAVTNLRNIKKDQFSQEKWRAQFEQQRSRFDLDLLRFELRKEQDARVADKVAAEAARDALLAKGALEKLREIERKKANNPPQPHPVSDENGETILRQKAYVLPTPKHGVILDYKPTNNELLNVIAHKRNLLRPPTKVVREFYFYNGQVPPEFEWMLEGVDRKAAAISATSCFPGVLCPLPLPTFENFAAFEASYETAKDPPS